MNPYNTANYYFEFYILILQSTRLFLSFVIFCYCQADKNSLILNFELLQHPKHCRKPRPKCSILSHFARGCIRMAFRCSYWPMRVKHGRSITFDWLIFNRKPVNAYQSCNNENIWHWIKIESHIQVVVTQLKNWFKAW